ncbi:hypothetical protein WA026_018395 [Henosepilachna vigintioctopunctata]|uniref:Uncharacterized protein n=1 Tax=Henosepilachna vigintioctopunctata TaxID=420089 RepID=A0AAW1UZX8_9CUCU
MSITEYSVRISGFDIISTVCNNLLILLLFFVAITTIKPEEGILYESRCEVLVGIQEKIVKIDGRSFGTCFRLGNVAISHFGVSMRHQHIFSERDGIVVQWIFENNG